MADFDDWELLQPEEDEEEVAEGGVAAEGEGLMMLNLDYFSIDSRLYDSSKGGDVSDLSSPAGSDIPSCVDPAVFRGVNIGEFSPDSGSARLKMSDCVEKIGLGFVQSGDTHEFELENQRSDLGKLGYASSGEFGLEIQGVHEVENLSVGSDACLHAKDITENVDEEASNQSELGVRGEESRVSAAEDGGTMKKLELPSEAADKKVITWWKFPLELVRFCVFRVGPLWSISVAAAMVGVFIMRRRLHMMKKRKTQGLHMKVTVDHKKVDQVMSAAARLNEAFSVVKHVPMIRPALPAPGVTPWPAMSMR